MNTHVFLLRHGESAQPEVFHGAESDIGLSERGQQQAQAAALYLAQQQPTAIVSSAMRRARDTAQPIAAACALDLHIESLLHERRVGILSGQPFDAHQQLWPMTLDRWLAGNVDFAPKGAESFADLQNRLLPVWDQLLQRFAGQRLVVVAHGVVIKVLLVSRVAGFSLQDWKTLGPIHNVGITELEVGAENMNLLRFNQPPPDPKPAGEQREPAGSP